MLEGHVLFGKYRLCRKLGNGRSGTVYLACHMELEELRAVKIVPKTIADYDTFKKEALFLKTLRHPGIPLVYDLEEDESYSYLIEEYLEGESLYAMVKRLGSLSMKTAISFGIQICRLIQFMNSAEKPILYLDLQPKNMLVNGDTLRLTDFDHAQYADDVSSFGERYGTIGFAAPEQYLGKPLDCRTDVYAIGALLYFMVKGKPPGREPDFRTMEAERSLERIIRGCMAKNPKERYQSAKNVEDALEELQASISKEYAIKSQTIVFAGARPGIGTTHAALGLSNFLTQSGKPSLYQEAYDTDTVRVLARNLGLAAARSGIYQLGSINIRPYYGETVRLPLLYFPIVIKDAGCGWMEGKRLPEADFYVIVCGGKWWENDNTLNAARKLGVYGRVVLLFNHASGGIRLKLPEELKGYPCLFLPFFPNPFRKDEAAFSCYQKLMRAGTGEKLWERKRHIWGRKRPEAES